MYATWLRGLYYGESAYSDTPKDSFFANYAKVIEALLSRSHCQVACLSQDPTVVLGYVVFAGSTIHWIFVKKAFRKMGIGRALLPERSITTVTHLTKLGKALKPSNWTYDPFSL